MNFKALSRRGIKRSSWTAALYVDLIAESERIEASNVKMATTRLRSMAISSKEHAPD